MSKCIRFVGLDDSKDSIDVAVASEGVLSGYSAEPERSPEALERERAETGPASNYCEFGEAITPAVESVRIT